MKLTLTKLDIAALRGEVPGRCDFCHERRDFQTLEPEEAGDWVCHDCLRRWLKKDVEAIKRILFWLYTDLEAAQWWFTPQSYLADRTPHEMILMDASGPLLHNLTKIAEGSYV